MAETERTESVVLNIPVKRQLLRDLLVTAIEGGSTYWASFSNATRNEALDYLKVRVTESEASRTNTPRVNRYITPEELANGLEALARVCADEERLTQFPAAGKHLGDALSETGDATTADVVLQMLIFGEVIYG